MSNDLWTRQLSHLQVPYSCHPDLSVWYDHRKATPDFLHMETANKKRQREEGFIVNGADVRNAKARKESSTWVIEDHPDVALEREKLLDQCLDILADENQKYGPMTDNSKTSQACRKEGMKKGLQGLYARIIWFELLSQISKLGDVGTNIERDSIFPINFVGDTAVVQELINAGRTENIAKEIIYQKVGQKLVQCAQYLINLRRKYLSNPSQPITIQLSRVNRAPNDPFIQSYKLAYHGVIREISYEHMKKLLRLYRLHTDDNASLEDTTFLKRVFCVIQRYESLSGKSDGYQMAFPNIGFQYLKNNFYVKTECFASPLNCFNSRFCSVARDTDQFFGSLGNFFLFDGPTGRLTEDDPGLPLGGSFEANPPFVEAIMNEMSDRIHILLKKYNNMAPFSFVVIVPAWDDCRGIVEMTSSEFNRPHPSFRLRLEKKKHDYRPGMQHRTNFTQQKSNVDTYVFFLQNNLGATRWPVTDRHCEELQVLLEEYSVKDLNNILLVKT